MGLNKKKQILLRLKKQQYIILSSKEQTKVWEDLACIVIKVDLHRILDFVIDIYLKG